MNQDQTQTQKPLFESLADAGHELRAKTAALRGSAYGDSWRNCDWNTVRAVWAKLVGYNLKVTNTECRAIALAALIDQKYARLGGGFNLDHLVDGANYMDALAETVRQLEAESKPSNKNES